MIKVMQITSVRNYLMAIKMNRPIRKDSDSAKISYHVDRDPCGRR